MRGTDPIKSSWVYPNSEKFGEKKLYIFFLLSLYLIYKFYINLIFRRSPMAVDRFLS
jgi:hypothetical protein